MKNLKIFKDIIKTKSLNIEEFSYRGNIYSITIKDIEVPNTSIIVKDYNNFSTRDKEVDNLVMLDKEMKDKYKIDVQGKHILNILSIGYNIYKKNYEKEYKKIKKLNGKEDEYIRKAYYGGRTEIYNPIAKESYYYDINSLYAYLIKTQPLPIGVPVYKDKAFFSKKFEIQDFYGFLDPSIKSPKDINIPILPKRSPNNYPEMGTIYPKDMVRGIYFSEEIKLALEEGYIIEEIYSGYNFNQGSVYRELIKLFAYNNLIEYAVLNILRKRNTFKSLSPYLPIEL